MLIAAGAVTAIPLWFFAVAAPRLQFGVLGVLQYVAPTIQFLLGITVFWVWPKLPADWAYHPFNFVNGGTISDNPKPNLTRVQTIATQGT